MGGLSERRGDGLHYWGLRVVAGGAADGHIAHRDADIPAVEHRAGAGGCQGERVPDGRGGAEARPHLGREEHLHRAQAVGRGGRGSDPVVRAWPDEPTSLWLHTAQLVLASYAHWPEGEPQRHRRHHARQGESRGAREGVRGAVAARRVRHRHDPPASAAVVRLQPLEHVDGNACGNHPHHEPYLQATFSPSRASARPFHLGALVRGVALEHLRHPRLCTRDRRLRVRTAGGRRYDRCRPHESRSHWQALG
mmetsp:Transcript_23261/g.65366  ORF Transcript_23261/g.65366 Transcript_23261/m.65366 type:complete len:251 (-) Transcript_23261:177-929(-)